MISGAVLVLHVQNYTGMFIDMWFILQKKHTLIEGDLRAQGAMYGYTVQHSIRYIM